MDKLKLQMIGKLVMGALLLPILLAVYFLDRFIWVVLCMGNGPSIVDYFNDFNYIGHSILRVLMLVFILSVISWLR